MLAVLAARAAFQAGELHGRLKSAVLLSRRCAIPVGFAFAAIAYLQAAYGLLPLDSAKDPTALMVGWSRLAEEVGDIGRREQAAYVLTSSYGLTSLLTIYSPGSIPVVQFNERLRWISFRPPRAELFLRPGLYVSETNKDLTDDLKRRFAEVSLVGSVVRQRGSKVIKRYVVYRLAQPVSPVLDAVER